MEKLRWLFRSIPMLKYLFPLVGGIVFQLCFQVALDVIISSFLVFFLLLIIFSIYYKSHIKRQPIFLGVTIILIFFTIGQWTTFQEQGKVKVENNYINATAFIANVDDTPVQKTNGLSIYTKVNAICVDNCWKRCNTKCLLTIRNDSSGKIEPGDQLLIESRLIEPSVANFPMQFDFKKYLRLKGIPLVAYAEKDKISVLPDKEQSIVYRLLHIRKLLLNKLENNVFEKREKAVLSSLLLGFTGNLDPELKNAYATAGVMHILSVSGLHVGIVYLFLMAVLFFLKRNRKLDLLRYVLVIIGIWFYALISGFSTPVIRSATMFTFIAVGQFVNRQGNPLNNLCISAILILLVTPFQLCDVGFQLSYTAMAGIFLFYEPIRNSISINNWLLEKIWELIAVSFAAQLATLPITLYYFHTFPIYFLLANLIIVPLSTIILYMGIFLLLFSFWNLIATWIAFLLKYILLGLNWFVLSIDKWPYASLSDIYMDNVNLVFLYFIIFSIVYILVNKDLRLINILLFSILVFTCNLSNAEIQCKTNKQLIVSKVGQTPIISIINRGKIIHITSFDKTDFLLKNTKNFKTVNLISNEHVINMQSVKVESDTTIYGIKIYRGIDNNYFVEFENKYVYVANNIELSKPLDDRFILVVNSLNVLKKINPENLMSLRIVALDDRLHTDNGYNELYSSVLKNTYFVDNQGAFLIEL
jgi:competence protein ComEC